MKHSAIDPNFPYLSENERYAFPPFEEWKGSIVAFGGNLSPGMLLSSYEQGIFPWYGPQDPLLWQSPNPRMIIFPETLHVSHSMKKILAKETFEIFINRDFEQVIRLCSQAERPNQEGTWINEDIFSAYTTMHKLGWALSAEAYSEGRLEGGCYGLLIGRAGQNRAIFCGESMFAKKPNASKAAFLTLAQFLFTQGIAFIDCQVPTDHLRSLGGQEMSRKDFILLLRETLGSERVNE